MSAEAFVPAEDGDNGARSLSPPNWGLLSDEIGKINPWFDIESFIGTPPGTLLILLGDKADWVVTDGKLLVGISKVSRFGEFGVGDRGGVWLGG
jgi:hypothetical protein